MQRIKKAYAENGDLKIIPETPPLDGSENWEQGRGAYYELDNDPNTGDPLALDIDREQDNYFKNVISKNIKYWQENSYPIYFDDIEYPKNAIVKYTDGNIYVSLIDNNTQIPTGANWRLFDITALDNTVKLTGNQTIAGVKTFSANPILTATQSTAVNALTRKDYVDGLNSTNVKLTWNQTIAGVKTFSANPISTATQSTAVNALTRKDYVDGLNSTNVKLTGNQTIAGVKTFQSSPIVPVPTANFKATAARSTNITVNVGAGRTYTTINKALEYLSGFYPLYKSSGVTATINLKAGFVMNEQVLIRGLNLGWITIVGEDAETIITHTALTTAFNGTHYPAFGIDKGGTSPVIGQLFRFNVEKVGGGKHGLMTHGAGSSANIGTGAGFIGAGTYGILATIGSVIVANGVNVSNAGNAGISAGQCSIVCASGVNASNAGSYGVRANQGSTIDAHTASFSGAGTTGAIVERGSIINASGATASLSQTANTLTRNGIIYQ